jgi:hypothetical protein
VDYRSLLSKDDSGTEILQYRVPRTVSAVHEIANDSTYPDPKAMKIVKTIDNALNVTTRSHLIAISDGVMLKERAANVVVRGVSVDPAIQKDCVERKSPILRGGMILMIVPLPGIVERAHSRSILIEVV